MQPAAGFDPGAEFDRQLQTLVELGYPALAGWSAGAFVSAVAPLRALAVDRANGCASPSPEQVPFVLVVCRDVAPPDRTMPLTRWGGRAGFADFDPADLARFVPLRELGVPQSMAYLIFDVERLGDTLGQTPDEATHSVAARGRTPITVEEGVALLTLWPEVLERNHCFHTAGSRCGDQRVPALWISKKAPKLGWCWARNRHTWLGLASCTGRAGLGS